MAQDVGEKAAVELGDEAVAFGDIAGQTRVIDVQFGDVDL